jgi:MYXO-CTERM domain-containing protein
VKTLIFLIAAALVANAGTIGLESGITAGESNNIGSNVIIAPQTTWAIDPFSNWISFENTGQGGIVLANTTSAGPPTAIFYQNFTLTGGTGIAGFINVWADDTAVVKLDGVVIFAGNFTLQTNCAAGPIGCTPGDNGNITFSAPGLSHTLEFDVYQLGGATFGLMYDGQVSPTIAPVPEPAAISIAGVGLAALGFLLLLRRRASAVQID